MILQVAVGIVCVGAGFLVAAAVGWFFYATYTYGWPAGVPGVAGVIAAAVGLLFFMLGVYGVRICRDAMHAWRDDAGAQDAHGAAGRPRPWLRSGPWRRRQGIVYERAPSGMGLAFGFVLFGGLALLGFWAAIAGEEAHVGGLSTRVMLAAGSAGMLAFFGWFIYLMLRRRRYGDSVCRLLTLPAVVGGWLKADIECALPPDPEPVVVRLKNLVPAGKTAAEAWWMEETLNVPVAPGACSIVPVRLRIPRDPAQKLSPLEPGWREWLAGAPHWVLEIKKKAAGVDFHASFLVPVYDTPDAPASEQRPE